MANEQGAGSRDDGPVAGEGVGDSRSAFLEAALHCFAQRGFEGTSIRDIAAEAGRNSSLISHHFGSKEGLYEAVFRRVLAARKAALARAVEDGDPPGDPAAAARRMQRLIGILCAEFIVPKHAQDPNRVLGRKLLLHELRDPRPGVAALLEAMVEPWIGRFAECLRLLRPEWSQAQARFLGISVLGQMMVHLLMQGLPACGEGPAQIEAREAEGLLVAYNLRALGVAVP